MPPPSGPLFSTRWVHVAEQDTAAGAVFLPADADIPLSRRPRAQLQLAPDGTGVWYEAGADDRPAGRPVTWREGAGGIVVAGARGGQDVRIVSHEPGRLIVAGMTR
jgi:hypothetical protein